MSRAATARESVTREGIERTARQIADGRTKAGSPTTVDQARAIVVGAITREDRRRGER